MLLIYIGTTAIWCIILTIFSFSPLAKYMSNRVFNALVIVSVIPVVNTIYLITGIINHINNKQTAEERRKKFIDACNELDTLLEMFINKFKKNG